MGHPIFGGAEVGEAGESGIAVKICGLTVLEEAENAVAAGAAALGVNFYPPSKRFLPPGRRDWLREVSGGAVRVGVFVNAEVSVIREAFDAGWIDWAQLHGDESPSHGVELERAGIPFIKAVGVRGEASLVGIREFGAGVILLDAYCPGQYGGGGRTFDWTLAGKFVSENPDLKVLLSGGLTPENVAAAVTAVRPAGVDVASGVETAPGRKDASLLRRFVAAAQSA